MKDQNTPTNTLDELEGKMWHWFADTPYSKLDKCKCCGQRHYQCSCIDAMYFMSEKIEALISEAASKAQITTIEALYKNGKVSAGDCVRYVEEINRGETPNQVEGEK